MGVVRGGCRAGTRLPAPTGRVALAVGAMGLALTGRVARAVVFSGVVLLAMAAINAAKVGVRAATVDTGSGLRLQLTATASGADRHVVEAMAGDGRVVAREEVTFASGALSAGVRLDLPSELRNAIQRIDLATVRSAAAAVLLAGWWFGPLAALVAGVAAVVGHMFTPWLGFSGGKGVATGLGVLIGAAWPVGLAACATWLAVAAIARISSLSALVSFAAAPLYALAFADRWMAAASVAIAALIYMRHAGNIGRLLAGTEPRIGQSR